MLQENSHNFKKFKKAPFLLSVLFLLAACLVFIFLYRETKQNQKITEELQTQWQKETERREEMKLLEHSIQKIDDQRILLETHFVQSSNVVPFLDTIEQLATSSKAASEVTSVDLSPENTELAVTIETFGSFEALYRFLALLENSPYELEFVSVDFEKQNVGVGTEDKNTGPAWRAVFGVRLLSFVQ